VNYRLSDFKLFREMELSMYRLLRVVLTVVLATLIISALASAQDGASTGEISISIVTSTPVTATLQLTIDGQVVDVIVPGLLTIDAQAAVDEEALANGKVMPGIRVGGLTWEIDSVESVGEEIEAKFGDPLISETGEFVVVTAKVTNVGKAEYAMAWSTEVRAIDSEGFLYEKHDRSYSFVDSCDSVNPGLSVRCPYLFEVPAGTEVVGLDVEAKDFGTVLATGE
jgi:hypothetical protein